MEDNGVSGRLFTSSTGNGFFGWWTTIARCCYIDSEVYGVSSNQITNTGQEIFEVLVNNNGPKDFWENGIRYVTQTNNGSNDWGKVSVGQDAVWNENGTGYMYEVLCFNYSMTNADILTLRNILVRYYTFI